MEEALGPSGESYLGDGAVGGEEHSVDRRAMPRPAVVW